MALNPKDTDVVRVNLDFTNNTKQTIREIDLFNKNLTKNFRRNEKNAQKMGKGIGQVWKMFTNSRESLKTLQTVTHQIAEVEKGLDKLKAKKKAALDDWETNYKAKHQDLVDSVKLGVDRQDQARLQEIADKFEKTHRQSTKDLDAQIQAAEDLDRRLNSTADAIGDKLDIDPEDRAEALARPLRTLLEGTDWDEYGDSLSSGLHDFLSRDAPTIAKRINKILSAPSDKLESWGDKLHKKGSNRVDAAKAAGAKGSGLGTLEKGLGGIIKGLAAIGPILTAATGFFAGFVKVLMDAEQAAKDYNKQLLATTSTAGYLSRNMGDAKRASKALEDSLTAARDGAHSFALMQMGISKDVALSFQAAITAEGVSLDRLGRAMGEATASAKQHTDTIIQGVAFARQFGISISDIAQMQGQLMADVGLSSEQVTAGFASIADGAETAGMEANKFFGIVRGFASDLSLFTLRIEDVSKIMGQLGKTMDPRKMGQFLQQLNQKFSGGIVDNLKFEMMAEKAGGDEVFIKDLANKFDNLSSDLQSSSVSAKDIENLNDMIRRGDERGIALFKEQRKATDDHKPGEISGPVVEAIDQLVIQNKRTMSGDRLDKASIMDKLSPFSKIELQQKASFGMFGKRLEDLSGIELAAAEASGIASDKEIQALRQFHNAILQGQEGLLDRMEHGGLTDDDKKQLAKMGLKESEMHGKAAAEALRGRFQGKDGDRLFHDSLGKTQQQLLQKATAARNFQEESANLQTSMNDKLGMITDILMNWIYKGLSLVTDILRGMWGHSRDLTEEHKKSSKIVSATGADRGLQKSYEAGYNIKDSTKKSIEENYQRAWASMEAAGKEAQDIQSKMGEEQDPRKKAAMQKRLDELNPQIEMRKKYRNQADFHKDMYTIAEQEARGGVPAMLEALETALIGSGDRVKGAPGQPTAAPAGKPQAAQAPAPEKPVGPLASQAPAKAAAAAQEQVVQQKATVAAAEKTAQAVANDGVKLHPATVAGPLKDAMAQSVYVGTAKALFEYYMYSGLNRQDVVAQMKAGGLDGKGIAGKVMGGAAQGIGPEAALVAPNHAMGGMVTGVKNGLATVYTAPPGEGFAAVGVGETIVPAGGNAGGGGSTRVQLELKGDLGRYIDARVINGIAEHHRNKRHR